jgi:hypothetical protein
MLVGRCERCQKKIGKGEFLLKIVRTSVPHSDLWLIGG